MPSLILFYWEEIVGNKFFLYIQIWRALNIVVDFVGFRVKKADNEVKVEVSSQFKLYVSNNRFKTDVTCVNHPH